MLVITSLISKALREGELVLDFKGSSQTRDFINAKDVARGMIRAIEEMPEFPVNLCSGKEIDIDTIARQICIGVGCKLKYEDLNLTLGPNRKPISINWDFESEINISEGILEVIEHVKERNN